MAPEIGGHDRPVAIDRRWRIAAEPILRRIARQVVPASTDVALCRKLSDGGGNESRGYLELSTGAPLSSTPYGVEILRLIGRDITPEGLVVGPDALFQRILLWAAIRSTGLSQGNAILGSWAKLPLDASCWEWKVV